MKKVMQMALAAIMITSSASAVDAASDSNTTNKKTETTAVVNPNYVFPIKSKIKISKNSYAQLTDINLDVLDEYNILTYMVLINNGEKTPLNLIDYWVRVTSKVSGATYTSNMSTADKNKSKILTKSAQTIRFFSKIDKSVKLSDLKFEIIKWDFSSTDYMRKLGEISIPKAFNPAVSSMLYKTVLISDIPIKMNVNDFSTAKLSTDNLFSITFQIENKGKNKLSAQKYKYYLKSDTGLTYPLNVDSSQDLSMLPKEKKSIVLGANIPNVDGVKSWTLQVNQEDETAKVELGIASFQLPKSTTSYNLVGINEEKLMSINNKKVGVKVKYASVLDNSDQIINLTVSFVNRDSSAVTLPKYDFKLSNTGYTFPLTSAVVEGSTSLNPLQEKTISLKAVVPAAIGVQNAQLLMMQQVGASTGTETTSSGYGVPVAIFSLGNLVANNANNSISMETQTGSYQVTLDSVQRLPWADSDILTVHLKIKNTSYVKSMPVPKLQGYIAIDGITASDTDTKYIQPDNILTIEPNSEIDGYIMTKIPYNGDYRTLQVGLQEKVGDNVSEVAQFVQGSQSKDLPLVAISDSFNINTKGKESSIKLRNTKIYPGRGSNILYSEVEMENLETRQANLSQLVGYFTSGNGDYYKANVKQQETSTVSKGKSLVTVWAKIPRTVDVTALKLMIGQGVTDTKLSLPKEEPTGYVNAALYELPKEKTDINNTLIGLDFFPYTLSIKSIGAKLTGGSSVQVELDYDLSKDLAYETGVFEHKLLLEIRDGSTGTTLEKEIGFDELTEGYHSINYSVSSSVFVDKTYGVYELNVYDVYQGQKRKIATQAQYFTN